MAKGGSSGGGGTTVQTATQEPWAQQKPFLEDVYQLGAKAYALTPKAAYTGPLVSRPSEQTLGSLDWAEQIARGSRNLGGGTRAISDQLARMVGSGELMKLPDFSSYDTRAIQPVVESATRPIFEQYSESLIPQLQSRALLEGAYGNNRAEVINPQMVMRDFGRTIADKSNQIAFEDFSQMRSMLPQIRQQQLGAMQMFPGLEGAGYDLALRPAATLGGVGEDYRSFEQDLINEALGRYQMQQTVPWIGLPEYAGLIQGGPNFMSATNTTKAPTPSTASGFIKGALGGAGIGGQLGYGLGAAGGATGTAALAALGPWAAGGAALGGLAGLWG